MSVANSDIRSEAVERRSKLPSLMPATNTGVFNLQLSLCCK